MSRTSLAETPAPEEIKSRPDVRALYRETGRMLWTPDRLVQKDFDGIDLPEEERQALETALAWIRSFILKPFEKAKGKVEAVCPFVKPALDNDLLFLSIARPGRPDSLADIAGEVCLYGDIFAGLEPKNPPTSLLRTIVLVFPDTPGDRILPAVDLKNSDVKTRLLEQDVMIGEFYRECPFPATWDETLFPLQSPVPFYALRTFIETDWRFIHRIKPWRDIYKRRFGDPPQGNPYKLPARLLGLLEKVAKKSKSLLDR